MPSRDDGCEFRSGHGAPGQEVRDSGDQIVEQEHWPGFPVDLLLLDQEQLQLSRFPETFDIADAGRPLRPP